MTDKIPCAGKEQRAKQREQWNHRIDPDLADAMRSLQVNRSKMQNNDQSLRDLTEEALSFFLRFNGIKIRDSQ